MNLLDDIPGIIRKSMKHFIICEARCTQPQGSINSAPVTWRVLPRTVVDNVIEFSVLGDRSVECLRREVIGTNVPTNGDGIPSKGFNLFNYKLSFLNIEAAEVDVSMGFRETEKGMNILADYNPRTLPGEDDGSAPSNSLSQTSESAWRYSKEDPINLSST